jgi:hypothetical protein
LYVAETVAERVEESGSRLASLPRITIGRFLREFKNTVEAAAVSSFWESRVKGKLKSRPEKLGQEIFDVFARARLAQKGSAIREGVSGIGFVDVFVTFSSGLLHVVEMKMLKGSELPGPAQLAAYMKHQNRHEGWLVFFDARRPSKRGPVPATFKRASGIIRTVVVDINPLPPHKQT